MIGTFDEPASSTESDLPHDTPAHAPQSARARAPKTGSLIVTASGRVLSLTPGVSQILATFDALKLSNGVLEFVGPHIADLLHAALHRDTDHGDEAECCELVEAGDNEPSLRICASRLDLAADGDGGLAETEPTVLISVTIIAPRHRYPAQFASCGLTPAEQEIAHAYANGGSIKSISIARARSVETIRTHLKTAMSKLGVHRQVELALIVAHENGPR